MKRITSAIALIALLALFCLVHGSRIALAQQEENDATIAAGTEVRDEALKKLPVMAYLMRDGQVLKSTEIRADSNLFPALWLNLAVGVYDVKIEGEGMESLIKRGVIATHKNSTNLIFQLKPGQGIHTVEYPTGAVSRDDVATRLSKLESAVEELKKK